MKLSARETRAISHYLKQNPQLRLSLQARHDVIYFAFKDSGEQVVVPLSDVLATYDHDRKAAAKARALLIQQEKASRRPA